MFIISIGYLQIVPTDSKLFFYTILREELHEGMDLQRQLSTLRWWEVPTHWELQDHLITVDFI